MVPPNSKAANIWILDTIAFTKFVSFILLVEVLMYQVIFLLSPDMLFKVEKVISEMGDDLML